MGATLGRWAASDMSGDGPAGHVVAPGRRTVNRQGTPHRPGSAGMASDEGVAAGAAEAMLGLEGFPG